MLSPSLFILGINKEATPIDIWEYVGEEGGCSPCFLRSFNDWEVDKVQNSLLAIQGNIVIPNQEDKLHRRKAKDGQFLMKLIYRALYQPLASAFLFC